MDERLVNVGQRDSETFAGEVGTALPAGSPDPDDGWHCRKGHRQPELDFFVLDFGRGRHRNLPDRFSPLSACPEHLRRRNSGGGFHHHGGAGSEAGLPGRPAGIPAVIPAVGSHWPAAQPDAVFWRRLADRSPDDPRRPGLLFDHRPGPGHFSGDAAVQLPRLPAGLADDDADGRFADRRAAAAGVHDAGVRPLPVAAGPGVRRRRRQHGRGCRRFGRAGRARLVLLPQSAQAA